MPILRFSKLIVSSVCVLIGLCASTSHAQGIIIPGGGAIHRAMAGVSTATPVDAIGAVYWNPAAPSRLESNEVGIGGEMIIPDLDVTSSLPGGPIGRTRSDSGLGMLSNLGLVYHVNDRITASMGVLTSAGGGVTFPGDPSNPILAPTGPNGQVILGPNHSSMTIVQVMPSLSMQVTEKWFVGLGPTISGAIVSFTPAYFGGVNDANGDGRFSFFDGSNTRPYWGGGFRVGTVYSLNENWNFGFSYTSPTWYETWKFYSANELGVPRTLTLKANNPAIYSWGIAYGGIDKLLLSTDLRFIDYKNADLFGSKIIDSGLNWSSVFASAFGARYQLSQRIAMMGGFLYNTNPVPTVGTLFNVQAPGITKYSLSVGASADLTDSINLALAYVHAFHNSVSGQPAQAIGANMTLGAAADSIVVGINVKFGNKGRDCCTSSCSTLSSSDVIQETTSEQETIEAAPSQQISTSKSRSVENVR